VDFLEVEGKDKEDIICEVFGLSDAQREIFNRLQGAEMRVKSIADEVDRDRSTVQRALKDMTDKELLEREQRTDHTVYYLYTAPGMDNLEALTKRVLQEWYNTVLQKLS
jgi:Predicted transcriptional regulator